MRAKILADNEDAIEEVVEEEISKGNIPTREKVLRKVRENKAQRDTEALKRKAKTYSNMKKYEKTGLGFKKPHYFTPHLNNHIFHVGYKNIELRGRNFDLVTFWGIVQRFNEHVK